MERNPAEEAFAQLKVFGKKAQAGLRNGARHYNLSDLQNILVLTSEFDQRLRQFKGEHHGMLLELYLYYVIQKKGRLPEVAEL